MIVFLHHFSDSIREEFELSNNSLFDVEVLSSFKGVESLIVISMLYFDFGDLVD